MFSFLDRLSDARGQLI